MSVSTLLRDLKDLREMLSLFKNDLDLQQNGISSRYSKIKILETVIGDLEQSILHKSSEILFVCKSSEIQSFCSLIDEEETD